MKITYNQLVENFACEKQERRFKRIFGKEVKITKAICKKYYKTFDFEWVVDNLFPSELYVKYYQYRRTLYYRYVKERKGLHDEYLYDKAMLFYKLSLTLD